jgi:hypothetical protein
MFNTHELSEIKKILNPQNKIVIITHYNPDGDAIGSSLGLKHYLNTKGVDAEVVVPNDFPKFLKWMPDAKKITIADYKQKKASDLIKNADIIFILDFNTPSRSGNFISSLIEKSKGKKILIDHHQQPDTFDFVYSDTTIPATCQMIYHFIEAMEETHFINENTAKCLYTGIMTDTGGFRYRSTSATTHRITANLIEKGAEPSEISSNTWDTNSISRIHLLSLILSRLEVINDGKTAILYLKRDELKKYGFEKGDTEGFVNYGLSILGVEVSAFFIEDLYEEFIKISFRSKKNIDVNNFSRKYFNGGGHINASGGKSLDDMETTISKFKNLASELK